MTYKSKFLKSFTDRGFFHQCTDMESLDNIMLEGEQNGKGITAYIGFDCTANSLHVGNLMMIMVLRLLKQCGHNPIILLGGATTKIGDPSGKDESRPVITDETIAINMAGIRKNIDQFGLQSSQMVNNDDWISKLSLMDMLQIARHFSVNRMLTFDSVKTRLERELDMSLLEFNYMIIQSYDFVELKKIYNCRLQIGGSDQWGNIVNGVELQRRIKKKEIVDVSFGVKGKEAHEERVKKELEFDKNDSLFGLTTPLITTSSGAKMGKSVSGAVWLASERLSTNDYWQFWRNTEDADVFKFMRLFTDIDVAEIARMETEMQGASINQAKIILANAATTICHGLDAAKHAEETARKVFEQGGVGDDLPTVEIPKSELEAGISIVKILQSTGLAESGGAAKRLIQGGAVKVNDAKVDSEIQIIGPSDLNSEGIIKISASKKKHALVKAV